MQQHVSICEVGPRDGLQIAKTRMTTDAKVRWIAAIAAAGVKEIEVGSFVPPRVIPQLADTPEVVEQCLEAGANYHLRKDLPVDQLKQEIRDTWLAHMQDLRNDA